MAAIKVVQNPRPSIWLDPLPRMSWDYEQKGRWRWYGDYGPVTGGGLSLRHEYGWHAFTERGIRRKLARKIRAERRSRWRRYETRRTGVKSRSA